LGLKEVLLGKFFIKIVFTSGFKDDPVRNNRKPKAVILKSNFLNAIF
jgi:hypothetical protein